MKVFGTAGHVDHGKSTLVTVLTGMDPDRLKEEKTRQMTIDLGFAWMNLSSGETIGFVDVPGHIDFIENMISGVGGIDAVVLVIAADEGVMPQTREHLEILDLLAIKYGVIALTKCDLVTDNDWLEIVTEDIRKSVKNTFLESAPIIPISAKTKAGIPELIEDIENVISGIKNRRDISRPRLSVDRVFTIKGFGTVVTGTLMDGMLHTGDEICILPKGIISRIRGLQSLKRNVDQVFPGSRVAINIQGIDASTVERGDMITGGQASRPSKRIDAYVTVLSESLKSLKHNDQVKVHLFAASRMGRIRLLGAEEINPGSEGYIQIEFSDPIPAEIGDRIILRNPSLSLTIGGGEIMRVDVPQKYKRFDENNLKTLARIFHGTLDEKILGIADQNFIFSTKDLYARIPESPEIIRIEIERLIDSRKIIDLLSKETNFDKKAFITTENWTEFRKKMMNLLDGYHTKNPMSDGISKSELQQSLKINKDLLEILLNHALYLKLIIKKNEHLQLPNYSIQFSADQIGKIEELFKIWDQRPYKPPDEMEITEVVGKKVFNALVADGKIIRVSTDIYFRDSEIEKMTNFVIQTISKKNEITVAEFRDYFKSTRKYALAFLEYLDRSGVTLRDGDVRRLGKINKLPG